MDPFLARELPTERYQSPLSVGGALVSNRHVFKNLREFYENGSEIFARALVDFLRSSWSLPTSWNTTYRQLGTYLFRDAFSEQAVFRRVPNKLFRNTSEHFLTFVGREHVPKNKTSEQVVFRCVPNSVPKSVFRTESVPALLSPCMGFEWYCVRNGCPKASQNVCKTSARTEP